MKTPSRATATALRLVPRSAGEPRPRVLVFRCCRPAPFAAAVAAVRARRPDAEIVALSHAGHRPSLLAAGVDRIVEIAGTRFGVVRTRPAAVWQLRRERFDEIVLPQSSPKRAGHGNLYRLAAAIDATVVTILCAGVEPESFDRGAFRRLVARQVRHDLAAWFQSPALLLGLLAAAWVAPRRPASAGDRRRVLHIISSFGVGGAQRQLAELVNRTPSQYEVDVLVLGRGDGEFSRQWFAREDVAVEYLEQWPRLVSSVLEIRRRCRAADYDIVHTWLFMANVVGVAGARLAGVPHVIASVRNLSLWKRTWYKQWWFRFADALCTRAADVVTVNAQALVADHAAWTWFPEERLEVVHNGLNPSQFLSDARRARGHLREAAGLAADAVVIGTVGRLAPEKDHLTFLRLLKRVRSTRPDVRGVIVGDGQLRDQLVAAAAEMGLRDHVVFLGERTDACRLMAGFDVFVLSSTIEGFPNVLLEAAFLGVPAVASRVGGSPDVLADPADTFAAGDDAAAARRVLALVDARSVAAASAELTRHRAFALFTAERTAARWFALYNTRTPRIAAAPFPLRGLRAFRELRGLRATKETVL